MTYFNPNNPADNAGVAIKLKKGYTVSKEFVLLNTSGFLDAAEEIIYTDMKATSCAKACELARETYQTYPLVIKKSKTSCFVFVNMNPENIQKVIKNEKLEGFITSKNNNAHARNFAHALIKKSK